MDTIEPEPEKVKKKRTDRTEALNNRNDMKETVIKKSLPGTLKVERMYPVISRWVSESSQTMNRGSLVFNRFLLHCLTNGLELPDFNSDSSIQTFFIHCFKVGVRTVENIHISEVWESHFKNCNFPTHKHWTGDGQMYCYVAKAYKTMFDNSLKFTFESRQKSYIRHWLEQNSMDKSWTHSIRSAVNGWKCKTNPPPEAQAFILTQRQILNPPQSGISLEWIGKHRNVVLAYFWEILKFLEPIETARKFSIAPIHRISSHFLTIDTKILYYISKESGFIPKTVNLEKFTLQREDYFNRIFKLKGLSKHTFTFTVQTDGVSICFHYKRPKVGTCNDSDEKVQSERMIGIDPGRSNLMFGVEKTKDGLKTYKLTRNTYYCASGMTKRNQQAAKWNKKIQSEVEVFSRVSPKTTSTEKWGLFISNYISVYEALWKEKTGKRWARARFRIYGLKKKVLDRFFNRMQGPMQANKPLILFGAAKFNPNSKNELSAPTTSLSRACSRRFKVLMVDEFNTTKVCSNCDCGLSPVKTRNLKREIRGLRRCSSSVCSQTSYKNRDLNAALNILRCDLKNPRPKSLTRGTEITKGPIWYIRHARVKRVNTDNKCLPLSH
jgi:hypothetical protein